MAIRPTPGGKFQVDVKEAERPRFRRTYAKKADAVDAHRKYLGGDDTPGGTSNRTKPTKLTLGDMFEHTVATVWEDRNKKGPPKAAQWILDNYWGWDRDAETVTAMDITNFKLWLKDHGNSGPTINRKISALSMMFKECMKVGKISTMPYMSRESGDDTRRERVLSRGEEEKLMSFVSHVFGIEWGRYLKVLLETGMRVAEGVRLCWGQVDLEHGSIRLLITKSGKPRSVPITKKCRAVLESMEVGTKKDRVFPTINPNRLNKTIWKAVRAHMNDYDADFVPHCLRHTRCTRLIEAGVDIDTVREWMGHASIMTTMRYVTFNEEKYGRALEKLEEFDL